MDVKGEAEALARSIEDRLGIGGNGLEAKLRRGGRRLPRPVREAARQLVQAEEMSAVPKLAPQIDAARIEAACAQAERALAAMDPAERRKTAAIGWLAQNAFNFLAIAALLAAVVIWRDLI